MEHFLTRVVGEAHVLEPYLRRLRRDRFRFCGIENGRLPVEQPKDALRRCHGRLQHIVLLAQIADRAVKTLCVLDKRNERSECDRVVEHTDPAEPQDQRDCDGTEDLDRGEEYRVRHNCLDVRGVQASVSLVEPVELRLFAVENLHDAHTGDVLLQERVDGGDTLAQFSVGVADARAKDVRGDKEKGHHSKRNQRQPQIHIAKDDHDTDQREQIEKDRHHTRGEHLIKHLDVAGQTRHQPSHGILVKERDFFFLKMPEDLHTQIVHDALPDVGHHINLNVADPKGEKQREKENTDDL